MAQIFSTQQGADFRLPEEGQVFKFLGDEFRVHKRIGNQLVTYNVPLGQSLQQFGSLEEFNPGDVQQGFQMAFGTDTRRGQVVTDPSQFQQRQFQTTGTVFRQPEAPAQQTFTTPSGVGVQAPQTTQIQLAQPSRPMQPTIDPKIQQAQQEIHKAQELQARVNQMLVKQGKQPVPIPGQAPQTPQNAPGTTQIPETTLSTSQGVQNVPQAPEPSLHDQVMGLLKDFGITPPSPNQSPVTSAADVYKQFADITNLFGLKKDMQDLINKKTQEIADVNENPWISEGLRSKKIANIENKYQSRIDSLQSAFNRADEDARFLTGKYLEQVHQTQTRTDDFLFKAIDLAEKEISGRRAERKERERVREFEARESRLGREFEMKQSLAERRFGQTIAGGGVQLDQRTVDLMAQTYLTTGQIPSLGFGTAGAAQRAQILKRAAQIAGEQGLTGQSIALNKASFQANQQALGQLSKQKNLAESFEKTAVKNLNLALGISNRTTRAGAPILTKWVQSVQTGVFADPQVQQLQNAVQTAVNEYAKVVTGQTTGAAVSDSARRETSNLLNAAFSPKQFRAAVEVLKKEMNNRIQGFDEQTRQLQREIRGGPTTPGASEKQQQEQEQSMSDEDAYQLYLQTVRQ